MGEEVKKVSKYTVTGETTVKPVGLPEGLQVVEDTTEVPHNDLLVISSGGNDVILSEDTRFGPESRVKIVFNQLSAANITRLFTLSDARKIGEWLLEVADSNKPKLRKATTPCSTWFEVKPDWWIYAITRQEAEEISDGQDPLQFGWNSWERLIRAYPNIKIVSE
jgi:hypothetical protein